jgi:hypothetical protein
MRQPLTEDELKNSINSLKNIRIGLTEASRDRLARRCRESAGASRDSRLLRFLAPLRVRRLSFATATLALVLASGIAFLTLNHSTNPDETGYGGAPARLVRVTPATAGGVTLEWQDGNQQTHRVQKTTDPRNFASAQTYAVRGTRWTDSEPARGQVVYYRVQ